jgi:hypothetical protein
MPRFLRAGKGLRETRSWPTGCRRNPKHRGRDHDEGCRFRFGRRSVRDVAIRLLEKRISAVPVLAANLQLL